MKETDYVVNLKIAEGYDEKDAEKRESLYLSYGKDISELVEKITQLMVKKDKNFNSDLLYIELAKNAVAGMNEEEMVSCIIDGIGAELTPELLEAFQENSDALVPYSFLIAKYYYGDYSSMKWSSAATILESATGYGVSTAVGSPWIWMVYRNREFSEDFINNKNLYDLYIYTVMEDGYLEEELDPVKMIHAKNEEQIIAMLAKIIPEGKAFKFSKNEITERMILPRVEVEKETRYRI